MSQMPCLNERVRHAWNGVFRLTVALVAATLVIGAVGCSGPVAPPKDEATPKPPNPPAVVEPGVVRANTMFGFNLLRQISRTEPGKNVFISPVSVSTALAMTYNGAGGETSKAMAKTLGLEGMSLNQVNSGYAALLDSLRSADPKVALDIANSLWARKGIALKPEFLEANRRFYAAGLAELDFTDPGALTTINSWVSKNTRGKIPQIIDRIEADSILFLVNATYFKGDWSRQFDEKETREIEFHLAGGKSKPWPTMFRRGDCGYFRGKGFQAVRLPYGSGRLSMYVVLPDKDSSLDALCSGLTATAWDEIMSNTRETPCYIGIPRLKLEYGLKLNDALKAMGMEVAFDRLKADFSRMLPDPPGGYIGNVVHKTMVEVNEKGTEAAAATSVEIKLKSAMPVQPAEVIVDRPYLIAVRDDQSGMILFIGAIYDPK